MPTYTYKCLSCGHEFDVTRPMKDSGKKTYCKCGAFADKRFDVVRTHVFEKRVFEHLGPEPVYIESKKQLKRECVERGIDPQRVPALN